MDFSDKQIERFWEKVQQGEPDECWPWLYCVGDTGYGGLTLNRKRHRAHRIAWMLSTGKDIPAGLCVLHTCDNPPCCNPAHLWLGTQTDNMRDRDQKERVAHGEGSGVATYSDAFVRATVFEHVASGRSITASARRQGIRYATLEQWLKGRTRRTAFAALTDQPALLT